jgi:hypothetical protein
MCEYETLMNKYRKNTCRIRILKICKFCNNFLTQKRHLSEKANVFDISSDSDKIDVSKQKH